MQATAVNPYIRRATHSILVHPFCIRPRVAFDYEIIYIEDGHMEIIYDGKKTACQKGDILFLHPGITFEMLDAGVNVSQPHIHFDFAYDELSELVPIGYKDYPSLPEDEKRLIRKDIFADIPLPLHMNVHNRTAFLTLFFGVIDGKIDKNSLSVKATMLQLLELLFGALLQPVSEPTSKKINCEIREYIDIHFCENITLDALAQQFNFNKYYLLRMFKQEYGLTVMRYYQNCRMNRSKYLLASNSVTEVSKLLNFSSVNAFSHAFKNAFGVSPKAFYSSLREEN